MIFMLIKQQRSRLSVPFAEMKKSPPVFPVKLQSYSAQQNSKELNNNYILDVLNKKAQDVF